MTTKKSYQSKNYRHYVLGILTTTYVFNFLDRQILSILQEPIKLELGLSDTQLGLLTGFSFAAFYITMGLPIARWADVGVRRNIISLAVGLWSLMTALSGLAQNFAHLLMARMGVGVGEAGATPPAHSMISDMFNIRERVTAIAIYNTGVNIGMLIGFLAGGWLLEFFGWRTALLAVGLPGLLLAALIRLTVSEPVRKQPEKRNGAELPEATLLSTLKMLWRARTYRYFVFAASMCHFSCIGLFTWMPPFLSRSFDMSSGEIGSWLALSVGLGGAIGTYFIGKLADHLGAKNISWYAWVPAGIYVVSLPFVVAMLLSGTSGLAIAFFMLPAIIVAAYYAPLIVVTHSLVEDNMRAMASAYTLLVMNFIGLGFGPLFIGMLSDALAPSLGDESLRQALLIIMPVTFTISIACFLLATPHMKSESQKLCVDN